MIHCLGALTKNIVAMKERLEGKTTADQGQAVLPGISEAQRRKEREMVAKEVSGEELSGGVVVVW